MLWICVGLFVFFTFTNKVKLAMQMFIIILLLNNIGVIVEMKEEVLLRGYPIDRCKRIGEDYILFRRRQSSEDVMPVELLKLAKLWWTCTFVYTLIIWIGGGLFKIPMKYIFYSYILGPLIIYDIYFTCKAYDIAFYKTYKRYTWNNWKYNFMWSLDRPTPKTKSLEPCKVTSVKKKRKRTYVTVRGEESGKHMNKVLFCGNGKCQIGGIYTLYQICDVKYIES